MFITFEGIEGAGKSTHLAFLERHLKQKGISVILTREPGGTAIGEAIRALLLSDEHQTMVPMTELLLMFAARAQHSETVIRPALAAGQWVVCDRFTDASYAYQGAGRGIARSTIEELERWVQASLKPDLTLIFDLPVALGLQRVQKRGDFDRFEQEKQDFFERVRQAYLAQASRDPKRYRVLNAALPIETIQAELRHLFNSSSDAR